MTDTMTTQAVLDAIARERERLLSAVDALGERATTDAVTEEGWTAKDVLGHCIHWAMQIAFGMGAPLRPPTYVMEEMERRKSRGIKGFPGGDEWNAMAVAFYKDRSLRDLRTELEANIDAVVEAARARTDEQMKATDAIPWAPGQPLWALIGAETFLHWPQHCEAIERVAGRGAGRREP
jgi:hypothetical protein